MASIISLQELISDYGYPRSLFINTDKEYSKRFDVPPTQNWDQEFYVIKNDDLTYCPVKTKIGTPTAKSLGGLSYSYIYNAVIKYIVLKNLDLDLKINMLLYILYYTSSVNGSDTITDVEITEGVILHISAIIKLLIDKEHTLYRDSSYIGEVIEELRQSLLFERAHTNWRQKINLRR